MTPKQEAIFDAVVDQRKHHEPSDILVYDEYEGQEYLNSHGLSDKYGIDLLDHIKILQELAEMGVFTRAGYVEVTDPDNEYDQRGLLRGDDGRYYHYQILISHKDVQKIRRRFKRCYNAKLIFDDSDYSYYHVHVDIDDGRDYFFRQIRKDGRPYLLIKYAAQYRKRGHKNFVEFKQLKKAANLRDDQDNIKSLFQDFTTATEVLPQFFELSTRGIRVNFDAQLSLADIDKLEKHKK